MHTPLSFIHYRDSSSTSKGLILHCLFPTHRLFTIHLKTTGYWRIASVTVGISSPSGASYIRENLRSSPRSSCLDSSSPSLFQTRFTPDLHIAYVLHNELPLTFLVVPYLQTQSNVISSTTISHSASAEEVKRPQADQEKQHERWGVYSIYVPTLELYINTC